MFAYLASLAGGVVLGLGIILRLQNVANREKGQREDTISRIFGGENGLALRYGTEAVRQAEAALREFKRKYPRRTLRDISEDEDRLIQKLDYASAAVKDHRRQLLESCDHSVLMRDLAQNSDVRNLFLSRRSKPATSQA